MHRTSLVVSVTLRGTSAACDGHLLLIDDVELKNEEVFLSRLCQRVIDDEIEFVAN
jgi:hypothetical protein